MGKIFFILLYVGLVFSRASTVERIDITRGSQNSAWQHYQNADYSIRDKVLDIYKIKKEREFLILKFFYRPFSVNTKKAQEFHIEPYYISHISVSTEKRILLDAYFSDLHKDFGGGIELQWLNNDEEKRLAIRVTDNNNHTTEYYADISKYTKVKDELPASYSATDHDGVIDYRAKYPQAWMATDIASSAETLYGKDTARKVTDRYQHMGKKSFDTLADGAQGVYLDIATDKKLSSLAVFSTTTDKRRVLLSVIDIPDANVSLKSSGTFLPIPVRRDGEILVVAKDIKGVLLMSRLFHIKAMQDVEEAPRLEVQLD